jgi:hypothetical protein
MLGHWQRRAFTREYTTDGSRKSIPGKVARALPSSPLAAGLIPFAFSVKRAASECEPCPPGWPTRATCPRPAPAPRRHSRRQASRARRGARGDQQPLCAASDAPGTTTPRSFSHDVRARHAGTAGAGTAAGSVTELAGGPGRGGAESHGHEAGKHQAEALLRPLSASGAVTAFPDLDGSGLSADCNYYRSSVPV